MHLPTYDTHTLSLPSVTRRNSQPRLCNKHRSCWHAHPSATNSRPQKPKPRHYQHLDINKAGILPVALENNGWPPLSCRKDGCMGTWKQGLDGNNCNTTPTNTQPRVQANKGGFLLSAMLLNQKQLLRKPPAPDPLRDMRGLCGR